MIIQIFFGSLKDDICMFAYIFLTSSRLWLPRLQSPASPSNRNKHHRKHSPFWVLEIMSIEVQCLVINNSIWIQMNKAKNLIPHFIFSLTSKIWKRFHFYPFLVSPRLMLKDMSSLLLLGINLIMSLWRKINLVTNWEKGCCFW